MRTALIRDIEQSVSQGALAHHPGQYSGKYQRTGRSQKYVNSHQLHGLETVVSDPRSRATNESLIHQSQQVG